MNLDLGEYLQDARRAKGITLRDLARQVGVSPSYICDIENGRRVPAEDVLEIMAQCLELEFDDLMARAGRFGVALTRYIKRHPDAIRLLQKCCELELSEDELRRLEVLARREKESRAGLQLQKIG